MDRCALFVDAGYILADGATAVHGTSSRDSVSWDYAGLLRFLASLSADRTGQRLLRCYWYEATADGRRTPEHDTLADLPGLTLRLGRLRSGQHGGAETDIHRDLTTLARNRAVSDMLLVSAGEDLTQVIADVQDLGIRVMIVHIRVDGNWTVSRSLRQQCDDVVQIDGTQLQPYVELIVGAEPARYDKPYAVGVHGGKPLANGHAASAGGRGHPGLPDGFNGSQPSPPAIYTAPAVTDYQPPARPPAGPSSVGPPPASLPAPSAPVAGPGSSEPGARGMHRSHAMGEPPPPAPQPLRDPSPSSPSLPGPPLSGPQPRPEDSPAPMPAPEMAQPQTGQPQAGQAQAGHAQTSRPGGRAARPRPPYAPSDLGPLTDPTLGRGASAPPESLTSAPPGVPTRHGAPENSLPADDSLYGDSLYGQSLPGEGRHENGRPVPQSPQPQPGPRSPQPARPATAGPEYIPQQGSYDALPPAPSTAGRAPAGGSLAQTAAAAHSEGFEFGKSVARNAPALWLEAVLARKPRMPSDLEARLLQGSALPIEALLHDEVRQALRHGFWDALERSRR